MESEQVGTWAWREARCDSLLDLKVLRAEPDLQHTVLRLTLDMALPMAEYDEAERILEALAGSEATTPRVGVLDVRRERLRLAADADVDLDDSLPEVLRVTAERLRLRARTEPGVAGRALHHLYRLSRKLVD